MTTSSYRSLVVGGALLATVLLLAGPLADHAEAGKKKNKRTVELVRPTAAPDADASGVVRITTTKRGEKGVLKLRDLDPKSRYEVHDADTDEVLGIVRTNRRGKARMKLHRKVRGVRGVSKGGGVSFEVPDAIEICRLDDDTPLLLGDTDDGAWDEPDLGELPEFGFAHYEGVDGWFAFVDMFSYADEQGFHLSLNAEPGERPDSETDTNTDTDARTAAGGTDGWNGAPILWLERELYEYSRDTMTGDELPLGVDAVAELSGRAFRVVDGDGAVLVRGVLPEMERPDWQRPDWQRPDWQRPDWPDHDGGDHDWRSPPDIDFPTRPQPGDDERPTDAAGNDRGVAKGGGFFNGIPEPGFDFDIDFDGNGKEIDFDDLIRMMPPEFMPFPMPEREVSDLRLEIANDDGELTDVGALHRIVFPEIDWPEIDFPKPPGEGEFPFFECPMGGEHDGEHDGETATSGNAR